VSRPGENATEALAALQRLYPPLEGSRRRKAPLGLVGMETWAAKLEGVDLSFAVRWAFLNDPSSGSSELILIKPRLRSDIRIERDFQFYPFDEIVTLAIAIDKSGRTT
jgi:hypothetical protein